MAILKVKEGYGIAIPIEDGYVYCRVISYEPTVGGCHIIEVFNFFSKNKTEFPMALKTKRLFDPVFASFVFFAGKEKWEIVSKPKDFDKNEAGYKNIKIAFDKSTPPKLWQRGKTKAVDIAELNGIESSVVWVPIQLEKRIQVELHGGKFSFLMMKSKSP